MVAPRTIACPKCGNSDLKIISARRVYAATDPQRERSPVSTDYVYRCRCGREFMRSILEAPEPSHECLQPRS